MDISVEIKFNRLLAKNNFIHSDVESAKCAVIGDMMSHSPTAVAKIWRKNSLGVFKRIHNNVEVTHKCIASGYLYLKDESAVKVNLHEVCTNGSDKAIYFLKLLPISAN